MSEDIPIRVVGLRRFVTLYKIAPYRNSLTYLLTANLLTVNSILYRSNDPTNSVIALKDDDGRPTQPSIPPGPHHHDAIIPDVIRSKKCNTKECMHVESTVRIICTFSAWTGAKPTWLAMATPLKKRGK